MNGTIFAVKNNWHKNGIWWFTKMLNKAVGEERYDALRLARRTWGMRFYYARQQVMYETFVDHPDLANWVGMYPKVDSSHGFPFYSTYEMYRDFQENTLNSDGAFAQWITLLCGIYCIHEIYTYMLPYYWISTPLKNDEYSRLRMRDYIASAVLEEIYGIQYGDWTWLPHDFAYNRMRGIQGYMHPDDPRAMCTSTFNRKQKYREHELERAGDYHHMTYPK
ncbi:hypothetical protein TTHERM_01230120 (macronuclear) [Tetrahymena thermophila SB210]|uniref:Uncharacterized protein n=1 Tax=Tetrahymena thermophila (strain SB210) TaxID=312017 RepID=Q22AF1_TETTS|nr:hypothetical protein TTHERM_01230120 [Tetrahymena thermophila SB210]EAR82265.1 hypothetical protein TTHERM_01230120 [Tetrahymena thermophila SB210]|eukprot:XP_001029928.1 hypothetical protein TTHERM_01230120 [Tetrahymena thermophila SB210]